MILDTLENSGLYESIHPRFKQAFDFLHAADLINLPIGRIELDGSNLFVSVVEINGKTAGMTCMETHQLYIDIQVPVTAPETMGWLAGSGLKIKSEDYNPEKDIAFFADKASNFIVVKPFEFAVFFPEDGHQPGIAEGRHKKIIVKVLV